MSYEVDAWLKEAVMRIAIVFVVTVAISFPSLCYADSATHRKAVEELFSLMKTAELLSSLTVQTKQMVLQQIKQMDIPKGQEPILEKYMGRIVDVINEDMSWERAKDDYIALYTRHFSEDEIEDLIQFYKSPIGMKFIEKMPQIMKESLEIGQRRSQNMFPKLRKLVEEMEKELKE